jgi:hypothetical protein
MKCRRSGPLSIIVYAACLLGLESSHSRASAEHLGSVLFSNSCSPLAQSGVNRGLALLHSFQYKLAESAFAATAAIDPKCGVAYWGEAMSLYHQLWNWPDEADLAKGHELTELALKSNPTTVREHEYIVAAARFFNTNTDLQPHTRVSSYSNAIAAIHNRFPDDVDAACFYALSLLALDRLGDKHARTKAIGILQPLLQKYPDHPGVAHYLIHATDTPGLARIGLKAARRYAVIAPASAHALHMPSHIFARLGFWQETVTSNLASAAVAQAATKHGVENQSDYQLHAMKYLEYAYLQMGENNAAQQVVADVKYIPGIEEASVISDGSLMEVLYVMDTHRWQEAAELVPAPTAVPFAKMRIRWAKIIGLCRTEDLASAKSEMSKLKQDFADRLRLNPDLGSESSELLEAAAWIAYKEDRLDKAKEDMQEAVIVDDFDVDQIGVPASELFGDLLRAAHDNGAALTAYSAALKEYPNRFNCLFGAAKAAQLVGKARLARFYFQKLTAISTAEGSRPEIKEAKTYLSGTAALSSE